MVEFFVEGRPAPKGSRIYMKTRDGRPYSKPASKYEAPWVKQVTDATLERVRHTGTLEAPYEVELTFFLQRPKEVSRRRGPWPTAHDLDKLVRAVVDGLVKGKLLSDDRHLLSIIARKRYAEGDEQVGVMVTACTLSRPEAQREEEMSVA